MGNRARVVALSATAVLSISAGQAKEVRYPAAHPQVSLVVPDDWKVDETALGLELESPKKDSLVLAALTSADKKTINAWAQRALDRMRRYGVVFALTGPAATAAASVAGSTSGSASAKAAEAPKVAGAADLALMNGDRPYTFGAVPPTVAPPTDPNVGRTTAAPVGGAEMPTIADFATSPDPTALKPAGHFLYTGGSLRGQPVDVELTLFPIGKDKRLLFEQQSGATDARGVRIMHSLHALKK